VVAIVASRLRGSTTTDRIGAFRLTLPAGHYIIRATNPGGYASSAARKVDVTTMPMQITLVVDSGIR